MYIKILAFCIGAVVGGLFTAKFLDEKYSRMADEEIESVKEVAKKTIDDLRKKNSDWPETKVSIKKEDVHMDEGNKNDVTVYKNITNSYEKDIAIEELTEEQFSEGNNEKVTVWFYGQDKAVIDDDEQPIDNILDCIGSGVIDNPENYFHFPDKTTLYLRNHTMGIDFEVIYLDKSYSKDILGLEE